MSDIPSKALEVIPKELPDENKVEVPYGDVNCRICRLPIEDLKLVHALKHKEGYTYKQIREYLKKHYKIGNDYTYLSTHFKQHVCMDKNLLLRGGSKTTAVVDILLKQEMPISDLKKDERVEKAHSQLVGMTAAMVDITSNIFKIFQGKVKNEDDLKKALEDLDVIQMMSLITKLHDSARSQIKDINALRAPKVMVMQFLEDTIDRSISEVNSALTSAFIMLQNEFTDKLKSAGVDEKTMNDKVFVEIFKKVAKDYKDRILLLRRDQISRAATALAEIEKIV